jgi:hypothetical protein
MPADEGMGTTRRWSHQGVRVRSVEPLLSPRNGHPSEVLLLVQDLSANVVEPGKMGEHRRLAQRSTVVVLALLKNRRRYVSITGKMELHHCTETLVDATWTWCDAW